MSQKPGNGNFNPGQSDPEQPHSTTPTPNPKPNPNPFETPTEELLIARLPNDKNATHNLILNKYPVIPNHAILATVPFKRQTDFLDDEDLDLTYACLQAWEAESTSGSPSKLFAFFNSGKHSGASQAHRHLQFLPVEDMTDSASPSSEWQPLIDLMKESPVENPHALSASRLPFRHFAMMIPHSPGPGELRRIYRSLYSLAFESMHGSSRRHGSEHTAMDNDNGEAAISYNLAMTTNKMAICPRRSENATIRTGTVEGSTAPNGTILAGTLMVKEYSDWEALRRGHVVIDDLLEEIGVPLLPSSNELRNTRL